MLLNRSKLNTIINHFGKHLQWLKLGEEAGEVYKAICRYEYGVVDHVNEIEEEVADLKVIIDELITMYDLNEDKINAYMDYKVERTLIRINKKLQGDEYI